MQNNYMLNERIDFIEEIECGTTNNGFYKTVENVYYSCWANFKNISGKEFISAYTTSSKIIVSFRVRYCKKLKDIDSLDYKIRHKNKLYNIVYVNDVNNQHEYMDLKCEVVTNV